MFDPTKTCWHCGAAGVEPYPVGGRGWYKCSKCGATWNPPIELASPIFTDGYDVVKNKSVPRSPRAPVKRFPKMH